MMVSIQADENGIATFKDFEIIDGQQAFYKMGYTVFTGPISSRRFLNEKTKFNQREENYQKTEIDDADFSDLEKLIFSNNSADDKELLY